MKHPVPPSRVLSVFITGGSSGFGKLVTQLLAENGHRVTFWRATTGPSKKTGGMQ